MSERAPKPEDLNPTNTVEITSKENEYMTEDQYRGSIDRSMIVRRSAVEEARKARIADNLEKKKLEEKLGMSEETKS